MVRIEFSGESPLETLASLAAYGRYCAHSDMVQKAAEESMRQAERRMTGETPPPESLPAERQDKPAPAPAPEHPQTPADLPQEPCAEEPPHSDPKPEDRPKPPKLEEVRAKGLEAAKKYGQPAVKAILESFGVPSMTSLAEGDRAAFLEKLGALEGQGDGNA